MIGSDQKRLKIKKTQEGFFENLYFLLFESFDVLIKKLITRDLNQRSFRSVKNHVKL